jgi:hypothetical protein
MQTHRTPPSQIPSLVPTHLVTLYASTCATHGAAQVTAAWTRMRRRLAAEALAPVAPAELVTSGLPPVDWLNRARTFACPPTELAPRDEKFRGELSSDSAIACALTLALLRSDQRSNAIDLRALRDAAHALVLIEPGLRRALVAHRVIEPVSGLAHGRMVRDALVAITFAEPYTGDHSTLCTIATAAMAQTHLDEVTSFREAALWLRAALYAMPAGIPDAVTAYEALQIRRGSPARDAIVEARLVALACEEARLSLIEDRPSAISIEIDLNEVELVADDQPRIA